MGGSFMELDFEKIISAKVVQMQESGAIEKRITDDVEKLINSSIDSALDSYDIRKIVRDSITSSLDNIAQAISLDAYSGFVIQRVKAIIEEHMNEYLAKKIGMTLTETVFAPVSGTHTLSGIFKRYHDFINEFVDENDRRDREKYLAELSERKAYYSSDSVLTIKFGEEIDTDPEVIVEIRVSNSSVLPTTISSLTIDGIDMGKSYRIGFLDEFQRYICQLFYNKIPIVIDHVDPDDFGAYEYDD